MELASPGAIFLKLGPLTIRWYGVMIAIGFLLATCCATVMAKRRGMDEHNLINCALAAFVGGIVGARLYFVALSWGMYDFADHPLEIFATWNGGLSIHGGVIGAFIGGLIFCKKAKMPFWEFCDVVTTCVPLAQAIGRWGNFFNSEAFGRPVPDNFPFKLFIPEDRRPLQFHTSSYFHPTFLYESIWDLTLFLLLYFVIADRLKNYPGMTFFIYLFVYSIGRLLIEPLRTDSIMLGATQIPFPIIASLFSLVVAIGGMVGVYARHAPRTNTEA